MGATEARHALKSRANGLAPSGVMGVWLLAGMLGTGPARGDEQGSAPVPPPVPVPAARKTHGPYIFFLPGGRTTHRPATEPVGIALVQRPARPPYMYFAPGKRTAAPPPIGPVAKPIPPGPGPAPPAVKEEGVAEVPPPRPPKHQSLIFFTPKRDGAKDRPSRDSPPPPTVARAPVDEIPVRVPGVRARKPQPYLIFQPKDAKVRPGAPPVERGTFPSARSEWSDPARVAASGIETPVPARPAAAPRRPAGSPAPPTYEVVVENRVRPATIPPLAVPTINLEAGAEAQGLPPLPSVDEAGRGSGRSTVLPAPLPADIVAKAGRVAPVPAVSRPEPAPAGFEPIRLTGATLERGADTAHPPIGPPRPGGAFVVPGRRTGSTVEARPDTAHPPIGPPRPGGAVIIPGRRP